MNTETPAPKITFPCPDYPIKALGDGGSDFFEWVLTVIKRHAPDFDERTATRRDSRTGRYQSVTVFITATGVAQLESIHRDLKASALTKMVM